MEYFQIEQDKRFIIPMKLEINEKLFDKGEPFVWFTKMEQGKELPDFFVIHKLNRKFFCFSDRMKKLLDLYIDEYESAVPFFPTDSKLGRQEVFWQVSLPKQDIAVKRNVWSKEPVRLRCKLEDNQYCAQIKESDGQYYNEIFIVSLPVAEHVLRKYWNGILFTSVWVKEQ